MKCEEIGREYEGEKFREIRNESERERERERLRRGRLQE